MSFFARERTGASALGVLLVIYAFAYPLLTIASGHRYPATPTFAVPCPTTILTIGLFLTAPAVPLRLRSRPDDVGRRSAARQRCCSNVPTDYVLLGAGVMLAAVGLRR